MADILRSWDWPSGITIAACTVGALVVHQLWSRPGFSDDAPRILKGLPILGSLGFFKGRADFLQAGRKAGAGDHFSFFYGPHRIIACAGDVGRAVFFGTRDLDFTAGYQTLLVGAPSVSSIKSGAEASTSTTRMGTLFKRFLAKNKLSSSLPRLVQDVHAMLDGLDTSKPMDAFGPIYELIYQLTHRTLGCNDIADDPKLLEDTLRLYTTLGSSSGVDVMFTWLPTPSRIYSKYCGAKLHFAFQKVMQKRRDTGVKGDDAMQIMMDAGDSDIDISIFIIGALFAGLLNSGVNASWIPVYLAENPEWYKKMQNEVDEAVEKHRQSPDETAADVFPRLSLEDWEADFPSIENALQDSIRLNLPGACIRKNISGKDIEIPGTKKVIPNDTFAVYLIDDVHMNPEIYPDPTTWDPSRYEPGREEDKKVPGAFLGWGSGFHPCLGMRFAKLEMALTTAMFVAYYDFELCEKDGSPRTSPVPRTDRNFTESTRKTDTVFLNLKPRF